MITYFNSQIDYFNNYEESVVNSSEEFTGITILENTEVVANESVEFNEQYCLDNNIQFYKGKIDTIGVGVMTTGSIILTIKRILSNDGECISDKFSKALCEYLKSKELTSARLDNNDILVDDYKVASGGEITINGYQYMGYQISINQDLTAIDNICVEKSTKTPKALSDYNITTQEIKEFCETYWNEN